MVLPWANPWTGNPRAWRASSTAWYRNRITYAPTHAMASGRQRRGATNPRSANVRPRRAASTSTVATRVSSNSSSEPATAALTPSPPRVSASAVASNANPARVIATATPRVAPLPQRWAQSGPHGRGNGERRSEVRSDHARSLTRRPALRHPHLLRRRRDARRREPRYAPAHAQHREGHRGSRP